MDTLPCSGKTALFFSQYEDRLREAERICRTECPQRAACLERAERLQPAGGVWGGKRFHLADRRTDRQRVDWTPAEDAVLRRGRSNGSGWPEIAKGLPGRTANASRRRAYDLGIPQPVHSPVHIHPVSA